MTAVTTATRCHNPRPGELGGHKTMAAVFFKARRNFASVGTVGTRAERRALPARKSAEDRYECDRPRRLRQDLADHPRLAREYARSRRRRPAMMRHRWPLRHSRAC